MSVYLELRSPPSLHARELREAFRQQCRDAISFLEKRVYTVRFIFHGNYYKPDGTPTRRDVDNQIKVILDEIARAGGIDDCWLQRRWEPLEVLQSDQEYVEVELT